MVRNWKTVRVLKHLSMWWKVANWGEEETPETEEEQEENEENE